MCGFTDKKFTKIRASVRNVGMNTEYTYYRNTDTLCLIGEHE